MRGWVIPIESHQRCCHAEGDLLVLVCAVLWAAQIVTIHHLARFGDPFRIALVQFVVCAVLSALGASLSESFIHGCLARGQQARGVRGGLLGGYCLHPTDRLPETLPAWSCRRDHEHEGGVCRAGRLSGPEPDAYRWCGGRTGLMSPLWVRAFG